MPVNRSGQVHTTIDERAEAGRIARVTIDYSERLNVLNTPIINDLTATLADLAADEALRVLVLTGAGDRAFIGGADIYELVELDSSTAAPFVTRLHGLCTAIRDLPVPVIARIGGHCLGAGLVVAAACDLRVAGENATFGMPEVRVGLPSVVESALLPSLMGWGKAREVLYTGDAIPAAEALAFGLVERVVPPDQLDDAVERWISSILASGPRAVRAQKALMRRWEALPLGDAITAGIPFFVDAYRSDEPRTYMRRFIDRQRGRSGRR